MLPLYTPRVNRTAFLWALVMLTTAALLLPAERAEAEKQVVVVLPMTSTAKRLRLYERAIASALAQELKRISGKSVQSAASASEVPSGAVLIVEGRLVAKGRRKVLMEARVRDAKTGRALATLATAATTTTNLDTLVAKLAKRLLPAIRRGLKPPAPATLPPVYVKPTATNEGTASPVAPQSRPPDLLLVPAGGSAARGVVAVREPATASALAMLPRLGFLVATSKSTAGVEDVPAAIAETKKVGARFAVMINVREVQFSYRGVLSARGTVQVAVVGSDGIPVFAKTVSTDTVVGSRGDRHQALVYQVASQGLDMLLPEFRKLAAVVRGPGGG